MSHPTHTPSSKLLTLIAGVLVFGGSAAQAATYTVGPSGACTHANIASAAASAEVNPGPDTIRVAFANSNPTFYKAQAITISASQELDIIGGFADCSPGSTRNGRVILDGIGGATEPVFRVTVPTVGLVRMSYLTIQNGDEDGSGKGGGIYFKGNGILELSHCAITQNIAGYGGGIYAEGTGTATGLVIGEDVAIVGNIARYNGGGVVNDGTRMTMTQPDSYIANNEAQGVFAPPPVSQWVGGYGGGLLVSGENRDANTYLGSSGFGNAGAIYLNAARQGGGVAFLGSNNSSEMQLFSTDRRGRCVSRATAPARWRRRLPRALRRQYSYALLYAWFVYVEDNLSPTGAAIAVRVREEPATASSSMTRPTGRRAINCPVDKPCGSISGNAALDNAPNRRRYRRGRRVRRDAFSIA